MKAIQSHFKKITVILVVLMFFQSCVVYKSTSVSLDDASRTGTKVKLEKKNGKTVKFLRIVDSQDGHYHGIEKVDGVIVNIPIEEENIEKVYLKDHTASTIVTVAIPVVIVGVLVGVTAHKLNNHLFE